MCSSDLRAPANVAVRDFIGRTIVLDAAVDSVSDRGVQVRVGESDALTCRGGAPHAVRAGQRVQIAIRPEHAQVGHGENALAAMIQALLFVGDRYEATLALDIGQSIMAQLSATGAWSEGQRISLTLPADDLRVWEAVNG